jgi:hypothetical protein
LNAKEIRETDGGFLFGLVCITGVLDGIPGNTKVRFFTKCYRQINFIQTK